MIKNIVLATCLVLGISQTARSEDIQFSQTPISTSKSPNLLQLEVRENVAQNYPVRRERERRRTPNKRKGYFGLGVGAFLPNELTLDNPDSTEDGTVEFSTGFALSFFGGYKFSDYFSGEIDLSLGLGNVEFRDLPDADLLNDDDIDYTVFGIYIIPRIEIPLVADNKFKLYIAPGVGYSSVSTDNDTDFDFDGEVDNLTNDSGFSYQIKGGASYAVSDSTSIFAQTRYNNYFLNDIDNLDAISIELGATITLKKR